MDSLLPSAWTQAATSGTSQQGITAFLPLIILFVVFYVLVMRPQMKRQKEHAKLIRELAKGDEAVTSGGILGRVIEVGANFVRLEIAKDTEVKVQKHAIAQVMPKGTLKEL